MPTEVGAPRVSRSRELSGAKNVFSLVVLDGQRNKTRVFLSEHPEAENKTSLVTGQRKPVDTRRQRL